jgi:Fe-S cluster assembly iron-binding protein IscA
MLTLDKKTIADFTKTWVKKLKVFFIDAGCSGTKIEMQTEFEVTDDLIALPLEKGVPEGGGIIYYIPKTDREYLENAKITRVVVADHTGEAKARYIFASDEVEDRCGCGTSFAFEKPVPVVDLEKLKLLRLNFKNKNI